MNSIINNGWYFVLLVFAVIIIFFLFYFWLEYVWLPFLESRDYLKMEIRRSVGNERKYWKRELRYYYLGCIPLIGGLFRKIRNHKH